MAGPTDRRVAEVKHPQEYRTFHNPLSRIKSIHSLSSLAVGFLLFFLLPGSVLGASISVSEQGSEGIIQIDMTASVGCFWDDPRTSYDDHLPFAVSGSAQIDGVYTYTCNGTGQHPEECSRTINFQSCNVLANGEHVLTGTASSSPVCGGSSDSTSSTFSINNASTISLETPTATMQSATNARITISGTVYSPSKTGDFSYWVDGGICSHSEPISSDFTPFERTFTCGFQPGNQTVTVKIAARTKHNPIQQATEKINIDMEMVYESGDGQMGNTNSPSDDPLVVKVTDYSGSPANAINIQWSVTGWPGKDNGAPNPGASVSPAGSSTAGGVAESVITLGGQPGEYLVTASCTLCKPGSDSYTFTVTADNEKKLVKGDNPGDDPIQEEVMETTLPKPLVVNVENDNGDGQSGVTVLWEVSHVPDDAMGAMVTATETTTGGDGYAGVYLMLGDTEGDYEVTATCPECTGAATLTFSAKAKCAIADNAVVPLSQCGSAGGEQHDSIDATI